MKRLFLAGLLVGLAASLARAEVVKVDVTSRDDVANGYERIVGRIHFAVDPRDPHNGVVADLDKAPRNAQGLVEFSADLYILKPKAGRGADAALVDIVNRGRRLVPSFMQGARGGPDPETGEDFLMKRGVTVVAVGWEFDVARPGLMSITVPVAMNGSAALSEMVRATVVPDESGTGATVGDLAGYEPADPASAANTLTVRDNVFAAAATIPRGDWSLDGNHVTYAKGFVAGKAYELSYRAKSHPIAGLGLAAVRDTTSWLKHGADSLAPVRYVYALGVSQSGRFLRSFLYEGFNTDEHGRMALDGVMVHIAGASRLVLNERGSTPTTEAMFTATAYPFATQAMKDPVSGASEGLLDNPRARANQPRIMFTNTGVEYWGGGRVAALVHTTPDGSADVPLADNVRAYFLSGAQHSPGAFPPAGGNGQQLGNPMDYRWNLRALFVALDRWVRDGAAPPASQYPRLENRTLVKAAALTWPAIPGVQSPTSLTAGTRRANAFIPGGAGAGALLPLLVPQVDADHLHWLELPEDLHRQPRSALPAARVVHPVRQDEGRTPEDRRPATLDRGAVPDARSVPPEDSGRCSRAGEGRLSAGE
jgi:hypothetical protein